ncbi:unnamed protein product [Rotaria sp. Silwood2]|nr:unnamed protein product [Rotaria sp. Silwood2]CAF3163998.1 unnamed protein product [Rotaria sp. Silwood2]CAF3206890.1 unnamed protein product [Rotaria sp. Silwood2]CAF3338473.1 unnamed protein product [Rotaria sp. Silwood2]CAF4448717.1 unnamed protein product [Rotaria sp. Silwood2]
MLRTGDGTNIYGLDADQLFELQAAFHQIDTNHNGYITGNELRQCLLRSGVPYNDLEIQRVLSKMDYNRDGRVSYDEYMKFMSRIYRGEQP